MQATNNNAHDNAILPGVIVLPSLNAQGEMYLTKEDHKPHTPIMNSQGQFVQPSPTLIYPSLYNNQYNNPSPLRTRYEKRREKKEQKEWKKIEKLEKKRQRVENQMLAKQPQNMLVIAVPLVAGQELLLLTTHHIPLGRVREKIEEKWTKAFTSLHPGQSNTIKGKTLRRTNRQFEGLAPSTRLLSNTPVNIDKVTLVHPISRTDERIFEDLVNLSITSKHQHKKRLIIYSIAFPFIAAAEGLAPGWPNIITVVDAAFIVFHLRAYRGSKRLLTFVANRQDLVTFNTSPIIDKWIDILASNEHGVLDELQIEEMCNEIGAPQLTKTLCELRRRHLRQTNQQALLPPKQR